MTVVCDSTTIIALARVKSLHLLNRLFGEVIIPQSVFEEIAIVGRGRPGSQEVQQADFIKTKSVNDTKRVEQLVGPLSQADAEVVVLAEELQAELAFTDDEAILSRLGQAKILGALTREVLLMAKQAELIESVKPILDEMRRQGVNIRQDIYEDTLSRAGEL